MCLGVGKVCAAQLCSTDPGVVLTPVQFKDSGQRRKVQANILLAGMEIPSETHL